MQNGCGGEGGIRTYLPEAQNLFEAHTHVCKHQVTGSIVQKKSIVKRKKKHITTTGYKEKKINKVVDIDKIMH